MSAQAKLSRLQAMLQEKSCCEHRLRELDRERRRLRAAVKALDAAIVMQGDPRADVYFSAVGGCEDSPAIAGRIGAA